MIVSSQLPIPLHQCICSTYLEWHFLQSLTLISSLCHMPHQSIILPILLFFSSFRLCWMCLLIKLYLLSLVMGFVPRLILKFRSLFGEVLCILFLLLWVRNTKSCCGLKLSHCMMQDAFQPIATISHILQRFLSF